MSDIILHVAPQPLPARPGIALLSQETLASLSLAPGDAVQLTSATTSMTFVVDASPSPAPEVLLDISGQEGLSVHQGDVVSLVARTPATPIAGDFARSWLDAAIQGLSLPSAPKVSDLFSSLPTPRSQATQATQTTQTTHETLSASQPVQTTPEPEVAPSRPSLADLPGTKDAADGLTQVLSLAFLQRDRLERFGARPPQGVLLSGPAGSGKTALVYAVADSLSLPVKALSATKLATHSPDDALSLLSAALAPSGEKRVVLLEDVDALASREKPSPVLPSLLELLDAALASPVVVLVATTSSPASISPALLTSSLLSRRIELSAPTRTLRQEILEVLTRSTPLEGVDLAAISERTPGFTPADLTLLVQTAALTAATRPDSHALVQDDLLAALRQVHASSMEKTLEVGSLTLEDVGGMPEVKSILTEAVLWPLTSPEAFARLGIDPPKGVLLYGPPGCGKTFIVRALAASGAANLFVVKGAELMNKYVGESEAAVRDLFARARAAAPSVIFLDEVDALAPTRGSDNSGVSDRIVASLLTELDGVESLKNVVVIGATNRPDMVDPALRRPGRLERPVLVPPPDAASRADILKTAAKHMPLEKGVDLTALAQKMDGYSSADCTALMREAAMIALRESRDADVVSAANVDAALAKVKPSLDALTIASYEAYDKEL